MAAVTHDPGSPPAGIARFDSASAMARALALSLAGSEVHTLSQSPLMDRAMVAVNRLPVSAASWAYSVGGMSEGISKRRVRSTDFGRIAAWLADLYPKRTYPAAFIGSSNGALMHLAAAMGVPWLPQTFLCPVRQFGVDPDDPETAFAEGKPVAATFREHDPELAVHHMHDPNQDRLMLRMMSYYRLKHRMLPTQYREFLTAVLPRGGTIYVDACTLEWPVTRTAPHAVFQFGALGGATLEDYFEGTERTRTYLARYGSRRKRWTPPPPDSRAPEAEWGFEPALLADIRALAEDRGWRIVQLRFPHPEALSALCAHLYASWYRGLGITPRRLVVDSFVLLDPLRTLRLRAIPFWSFFAVEPSARHLETLLAQMTDIDELDLMLFSHGTRGIGVVPIKEWRRIVGARQLRFIGVDQDRYPIDFATFTRFQSDMKLLQPVADAPPPLAVARFDDLLAQHGAASGVEVVKH